MKASLHANYPQDPGVQCSRGTIWTQPTVNSLWFACVIIITHSVYIFHKSNISVLPVNNSSKPLKFLTFTTYKYFLQARYDLPWRSAFDIVSTFWLKKCFNRAEMQKTWKRENFWLGCFAALNRKKTCILYTCFLSFLFYLHFEWIAVLPPDFFFFLSTQNFDGLSLPEGEPGQCA